MNKKRKEGFWWAQPRGERWRVVEVSSSHAVMRGDLHVFDPVQVRQTLRDYEWQDSVQWGPYLGADPADTARLALEMARDIIREETAASKARTEIQLRAKPAAAPPDTP